MALEKPFKYKRCHFCIVFHLEGGGKNMTYKIENELYKGVSIVINIGDETFLVMGNLDLR